MEKTIKLSDRIKHIIDTYTINIIIAIAFISLYILIRKLPYINIAFASTGQILAFFTIAFLCIFRPNQTYSVYIALAVLVLGLFASLIEWVSAAESMGLSVLIIIVYILIRYLILEWIQPEK